MIVCDPIAETLHNHIAYIRVVAVQCITTAAEVEVTAIGREHVISLVVDAAIGDVGTSLVTFCGMVEHHVEDHLDAVGVQPLHEVLQLIHLHAESS